jgi:hypothetical protein
MKKFWDTQAIRASYSRINATNIHRSRTSLLRSIPRRSEIWNIQTTQFYRAIYRMYYQLKTRLTTDFSLVFSSMLCKMWYSLAGSNDEHSFRLHWDLFRINTTFWQDSVWKQQYSHTKQRNTDFLIWLSYSVPLVGQTESPKGCILCSKFYEFKWYCDMSWHYNVTVLSSVWSAHI